MRLIYSWDVDGGNVHIYRPHISDNRNRRQAILGGHSQGNNTPLRRDKEFSPPSPNLLKYLLPSWRRKKQDLITSEYPECRDSSLAFRWSVHRFIGKNHCPVLKLISEQAKAVDCAEVPRKRTE